MFQESLLESAGGVKTSQRWTTLLSLALEGLVIGLLVLLPLLENQAEPHPRWTLTTPVAPPRLGVFNPQANGGGGRTSGALHLPLAPPDSTRPVDLTPYGPGQSSSEAGVNLPLGVPWGVPNSLGPVLPAPLVSTSPPEAPVSPRISIVSEGNVVHRVLPVYPPIARQIGAQGPVVLQAVISKEGTVEDLRVVSSAHPSLNQAALDAVRQWRFRPYLLNGVPVEVEAQVTVNFVISH